MEQVSNVFQFTSRLRSDQSERSNLEPAFFFLLASSSSSSSSRRALFKCRGVSVAFDKLIGDTNKILSGYIKIKTFTHTQVEKSKR